MTLGKSHNLSVSQLSVELWLYYKMCVVSLALLLSSVDGNCISPSPLSYVVLGLSCPGEKLTGDVEGRSKV